MPITTVDPGDGSLSILLYGIIDGLWDISAEEFGPLLFAADNRRLSRIDLRIASRGGDVMAALTMHSAIQACKTPVTAHIDGIAASAASVIAMAADEIVIGENSYLMIHDPWGVAVGSAGEMRAAAKQLDEISGNCAEMYAKKSGQKISDITTMMENETWMRGNDAVALGFADRTSADAAPKLDSPAGVKMMQRYRNVPQALMIEERELPKSTAVHPSAETPPAAPPEETPAAAPAPPEETAPAAPPEETPVAPAVAAAEPYPHAEVLDLCLLAGHAEMARGFFAALTPLTDVRAKLIDVNAAEDARAAISTHSPPKDSTHGWGDAIAKATSNGAGR